MKSLTNRIFLGAALLVILSIAAAVYRVNVTVGAQAERELQRELQAAGAVVDEYRTVLFGHFLREARLLADLPKLKAAVATRDAATVQQPADDYRQQIDSDVLIVTGPVTQNMREALEFTHEATPNPKWVVAVGDCARDGGIFAGSYAVAGGVSQVVPVDLHIAGCPPRPIEIMRGLLALLELAAGPGAQPR